MKKYVVFCSIFFVACGSQTSQNSGEICREYATSYTSDQGITNTCSFNTETSELTCADDSSRTTTKEYANMKDFVMEASIFGIEKHISRTEDNGSFATLETNTFENGLLKSKYFDVSDIHGEGSYVFLSTQRV